MTRRKRRQRSLRKKRKGTMPDKQKAFNSDGATQATNQLGLKNERIRMYFVYIAFILCIIIGLIFVLLNITDTSFMLNWGNVQFKATVVGFILILFCIWGIYKFDPKTSVKNERD